MYWKKDNLVTSTGAPIPKISKKAFEELQKLLAVSVEDFNIIYISISLHSITSTLPPHPWAVLSRGFQVLGQVLLYIPQSTHRENACLICVGCSTQDAKHKCLITAKIWITLVWNIALYKIITLRIT